MMKNFLTVIVSYTLSLSAFWGCSKGEAKSGFIQPGARIIQFSGYEWVVRSTDDLQQGPGPNYFSDAQQNVWVDGSGQLHLKITHENGKWYCAEVTLRKVFGPVRYVFELNSQVADLDKNAVGALFLYKDDDHEIDIEFSKWGLDENKNTQYVIQPGDKAGNKTRFLMEPSTTESVHWIDWQKDSVGFASYYGTTEQTTGNTHLINQWTYKGADNPDDKEEVIKINLWLFKGEPPADQKEQTLIVKRFSIQ